MTLLVNFSNVIGFVIGSTRDKTAMKNRVKLGYEGACSDHVTRYDEVGLQHYTKLSQELLKDIVIQGKEVLDVGCGTGILSMTALEQGAKKVTCGDLSEYMLGQCKAKAARLGYSTNKIDFRQLDAEALPYDDNSYDVVISGMVLELSPDPQKMINEMVRVVRPGGAVALSTHGTNHYNEGVDACFRAVTKRYVLGYRMEYWPIEETKLKELFSRAELENVATRRLTWQDDFGSGDNAFDFVFSTSSAWWYAKFPSDKIAGDIQKTRDYFVRNKVTKITQDVVLAYGQKPG
jgi:ubiquinone/menaquinone biosynthesis C-methylase UbiE